MQYPFADAHCDFLAFIHSKHFHISHPTPLQHISLPYLQQGNVKLQFFAMWPNLKCTQSATEQCSRMLNDYQSILRQYHIFQPLDTHFDLNNEKISTVLTIEGGEAIGNELDILHQFFNQGVRALTLTWNYPNAIAHSSLEGSSLGLTDFGRKVVKEMNTIGMAIDVSHLNDAGIEDLLCLSTQPIFASHSNARALCDHPRCLCDDHIRAISQMGGVIGVNFCSTHLTTHPTASLKNVLAHLDHIIQIGGIHAACIGSDFDGIDQCPIDLPNSSAMQKIANGLKDMGYSDKEIYQISYLNLHDYIIQFI